jgi:hypothetical protein
MTAKRSVDELARAALRLNVSVLYRAPPAKIAVPKTKSRFPTNEPVIDAFTTSIRPARSANVPIRSSVALPNVAFSSPPKAGLLLAESSSVASPINFASGMIASADRKKS